MSMVTMACPVCGGIYTFGVVGSAMVGTGHVCPVKTQRDEAVALLNSLDAYVGHWEDCDGCSGAPECSCGFDELYTRVRTLVRAALPSREQGDTK